MNVKRTENGFEITRDDEVVAITTNEACLIYEMMKQQTIKDVIEYTLEEVDKDDWNFELSLKEIISDEELMDELVEEAIYNDINIYDSEEVLYMVERYVDIKEGI
jgi:hypothetical protein